MTAKLIFWVAAGFVAYVYVGYPGLLGLVQLLFRRTSRKAAITPSVSLVVAAYNEAGVVAAKIRNALALDYPPERLEIVIASDGSTDGTAQIVREIMQHEGRRRVRLLDFHENRGKIAVLNDAVSQVAGEIVVFSDASTMLAADSLRTLVANFADERVGTASGIYRVLKRDTAALGHQEDFYWRYETFLKDQESKLGCLLGAHGSLFAVRRELYPYPPPGTINDDFIIPIRVLQGGFRGAYELEAVAYEEAHEMAGFGRRVRIAAGNVEQLSEIRRFLWPLRLVVLFCFLSHKAGRVVSPIAMIAALLSSIALWHDLLYSSLLVLQVVFYALAVAGARLPLRPKFLRLPYYFCMINVALFAWIYHALRIGQLIPSRRDMDRVSGHKSWERI